MDNNYFNNACLAVKELFKNLVLYLPDLILYTFTILLTLSFFNLNNLTTIFSDINLFGTQIKNITSSSNLLIRLVGSLIILLIINVIIGLGTVSLRYTLVKMVINKKKASLKAAYKSAGKYILSLFGVKVIVFLIYLIPFSVFMVIGLAYKPLLIFMIILLIISWIILRFVFLFLYTTLFLKDIKSPTKVIKETVEYFEKNKKHVVLTGFFIFIVSLVLGFFINYILPNFQGIFIDLTPILVLFLIIKILFDITLMLWAALFLFKSY